MNKEEALNLATEYLNKNKSNGGDINEHLETLLSYAKQSESITEMGVRFVVSTWPFVLAQPKKIVCVDIDNVNRYLQPVFDVCSVLGIDIKFVQGSTLDIDIEETDLLFIDTDHTYNQLFQELNRHANKAKKWIIMHDTEAFKEMTPAIYDFLKNNENWFVKEVFTNNNGLTVLERKC